jgi:sugar lactone lactonase YvrE
VRPTRQISLLVLAVAVLGGTLVSAATSAASIPRTYAPGVIAHTAYGAGTAFCKNWGGLSNAKLGIGDVYPCANRNTSDKWGLSQCADFSNRYLWVNFQMTAIANGGNIVRLLASRHVPTQSAGKGALPAPGDVLSMWGGASTESAGHTGVVYSVSVNPTTGTGKIEYLDQNGSLIGGIDAGVDYVYVNDWKFKTGWSGEYAYTNFDWTLQAGNEPQVTTSWDGGDNSTYVGVDEQGKAMLYWNTPSINNAWVHQLLGTTATPLVLSAANGQLFSAFEDAGTTHLSHNTASAPTTWTGVTIASKNVPPGMADNPYLGTVQTLVYTPTGLVAYWPVGLPVHWDHANVGPATGTPGVAWDPQNSTMYAAVEDNGMLDLYWNKPANGVGWSEKTLGTVTKTPAIAWNPGNDSMYVAADANGSLSLYWNAPASTSSWSHETLAGTQAGMPAIAWDTGNKSMYVADSQGGSLIVYWNTPALNAAWVHSNLGTGTAPPGLTWSPGSSKFVAATEDGDIPLVYLTTSAPSITWSSRQL